MYTSWKRTLGIILSTGLFIMPLGAYATVGDDQDTTAIGHAAEAHHHTGLDEGGTKATRGDSSAEVDALTPDHEATSTASGQDLPIAQTGDKVVQGADSQTAVAPQDDAEGNAKDKSTQTDVLAAEGEGAGKSDKADSTADDEDEFEKVNINTATAEELAEGLKGIGPSKAGEIIKYREKHGPFKKIDHLKKVKGIGTATYEKIQSQLEL
ncbi:ComEA family DNA-binding protein [Sodalis ligni]|uniref:ComEA protein n=1 Tax=Sodalis ligni TaxID=2697027 RepID=A0A4R1N9P8_9GAMM|nr:helix-hairpin-helix domain-containing protein [Sodalis ligni]TCL04125.1 comEA protein [Sodalis ligni]